MPGHRKQLVIVAGAVLFAVLGAFIWTRFDAGRFTGPAGIETEGGVYTADADRNAYGPSGSAANPNAGDAANGHTDRTDSDDGTSGRGPDGILTAKDDSGASVRTDGASSHTTGGGNTAGGAGGSGKTGGGSGPAGPDPFAGDPGSESGNASSAAPDGIPASPHKPVIPADDGKDPETHPVAVDLPSLFYPVEKESDPGVGAEGLIAYLLERDPSVLRDEAADTVRLIVYADGDSYEVKTLADGGALATLTYRFPTGQKSRRGDLTYDEAGERPRMFAALEYLLPGEADPAESDFTAMRHWEAAYLRAYGLTEPDWSAFVRSRYFGTRYVRMSVTRDTVTVTVYPDGYRDELGDFAKDGSYREFYTYPIR